ncbi:unnamed protein product [Lasius platythorax]|uniref:Uncharacterized protein n=1 Tax=Lasius platythorax TaxID=488582 RepID=A0AAV2NMW9_9HYME
MPSVLYTERRYLELVYPYGLRWSGRIDAGLIDHQDCFPIVFFILSILHLNASPIPFSVILPQPSPSRPLLNYPTSDERATPFAIPGAHKERIS